MLDKLICNLLNKVLGTYIENLDGSNLKLSLWSGKAELNNLDIKQSALEELQLPIRPVYGHLDKLRLVIPWNNLFAGVWEAHVSGVMLLVAPNTSITYDKDKEEKLLHQAKMAMLEKIELAQAKAAAGAAANKATTPADDGYLEKLIAQVVRNIQVTITDVHVRYEDNISTPEHPFSFGVTLASLSVISTDKHYTQCLDTDRLVYKDPPRIRSSLAIADHPDVRRVVNNRVLIKMDPKKKKKVCHHHRKSLFSTELNPPEDSN
ncbi:vacuolar protein sorting-associated protein 13C [Hyalella azteca]|uniref:Vacuolar protein sorting-associated protein 13C n=1 Tax=Hyalella azteca TaxID=294128 RepID=A0A8B7P5P5_HYAAZ|nr:vacuolar protein sorting-associated protein 13C [Hyalella azteca]